MSLEQAADDTGFDIRMGTKDDNQARHLTHLQYPAISAGSTGEWRRIRRDLVDLQQNHRHVVVLRCTSGERLHFAQHALPQLVGGKVCVLFGQTARAVLLRRSRRLRSWLP